MTGQKEVCLLIELVDKTCHTFLVLDRRCHRQSLRFDISAYLLLSEQRTKMKETHISNIVLLLMSFDIVA